MGARRRPLPDPIALAQFQGLFGAVMNFVSVLFVVTLGGWLLTRFGIGFGLAANPLGVLVLLCATTVVGYAVGPASLLFFGLVCAQAVTDISLTDGTTRTSINATYQALQPDERVRAQTMVEGAGVPLALGFVGILLIGFDVVGLDITAVVVVALLLTALWLASAGLAFREYGVNLRGVLVRRAWDPVALRIDDAASHAAVNQLLASADPHDVHAALDALVDAGRDVSDHVLALLTDPEPARRDLGLEIAVATGRLTHAGDRGPGAGHARRPRPGRGPVRGRIAGAARHRPPGGRSVGVAGRRLRRGPATVRRALRAAAAFPHRFFVPYLVGLASAGSAAGDVLDALGANCDHLAPLVQGLICHQSVPRQTRERIVHFLGMAVTPEARDLLVAHLDDDDPAIVEAAGLCLVVVGHSETPERLDLAPRLVIVAERVDRCLQILLLLDDRSDLEPLAGRCATRSPLPPVGSRCSSSWSTTPARSGRRSPSWRRWWHGIAARLSRCSRSRSVDPWDGWHSHSSIRPSTTRRVTSSWPNTRQ